MSIIWDISMSSLVAPLTLPISELMLERWCLSRWEYEFWNNFRYYTRSMYVTSIYIEIMVDSALSGPGYEKVQYDRFWPFMRLGAPNKCSNVTVINEPLIYWGREIWDHASQQMQANISPKRWHICEPMTHAPSATLTSYIYTYINIYIYICIYI